MRVGGIYWMQNSFTHTVTELSFGVQMEYSEGFFRGFLLIRPIIQKSALFIPFLLTY